MFGDNFSNDTIKKVVAVFGTLFNNISLVRRSSDGETILSTTHVPLAFSSRDRTLAKIRQDANKEGAKVAIQLPRIGYEITGLSPDPSRRTSAVRPKVTIGEGGAATSKPISAPWILNFTVSVYAKRQSEAFQIIEQILPYFNPSYSVAVEGIEGSGVSTDLVFKLESASPNVDYEGDFQATRRTVIYTLDFSVPIRFAGPETEANVIRKVIVNLHDTVDTEAEPVDRITHEVGDDDTPDDYTITTTYGLDDE